MTLATLAALAALPYPPAAAVLGAPLVAYLALSVVTGLRGLRHGLGAALLVPSAMLAIVFGFGTGYGMEVVRALRRSSRRARSPFGGHPRLR